MKKAVFLFKVLIFYYFFGLNAIYAKSENFEKGKNLFDKKEFEKSKIFFEKDLVFNPKSEMSYLYLAKIFNNIDNDNAQEMNLSSVLLLNPKNDEAIYMLAILKIKQSDFSEAKKLIEQFDLVCSSFCSRKSEIKKKFDELIPENEKGNN